MTMSSLDLEQHACALRTILSQDPSNMLAMQKDIAAIAHHGLDQDVAELLNIITTANPAVLLMVVRHVLDRANSTGVVTMVLDTYLALPMDIQRQLTIIEPEIYHRHPPAQLYVHKPAKPNSQHHPLVLAAVSVANRHSLAQSLNLIGHHRDHPVSRLALKQVLFCVTLASSSGHKKKMEQVLSYAESLGWDSQDIVVNVLTQGLWFIKNNFSNMPLSYRENLNNSIKNAPQKDLTAIVDTMLTHGLDCDDLHLIGTYASPEAVNAFINHHTDPTRNDLDIAIKDIKKNFLNKITPIITAALKRSVPNDKATPKIFAQAFLHAADRLRYLADHAIPEMKWPQSKKPTFAVSKKQILDWLKEQALHLESCRVLLDKDALERITQQALQNAPARPPSKM